MFTDMVLLCTSLPGTKGESTQQVLDKDGCSDLVNTRPASTLSWFGPYVLRNTDICQESSFIERQLCTPEGAVFQFSYLYFLSTPVVICYLIHLKICQLRICPQQRFGKADHTLPICCFLSMRKAFGSGCTAHSLGLLCCILVLSH